VRGKAVAVEGEFVVDAGAFTVTGVARTKEVNNRALRATKLLNLMAGKV